MNSNSSGEIGWFTSQVVEADVGQLTQRILDFDSNEAFLAERHADFGVHGGRILRREAV